MINDLPTETHTIVIGAGTGGATCAGILAEHGTERVLLLEAGPDYGPLDDGRWPAEILDARAVPLSHDWDYNSGDSLPNRVLDFPRACIVGGCSAHNGCTAAVGAHADYDDWAAVSDPGWGSVEIEPLIDLVRRRFQVRSYEFNELTPIQKDFVDAGRASGLPLADDLDELTAGVGIGPMAINIVDGVRFNSAFAFLDPVRDNPRLMILGGTLVDRIVTEAGRVTGVRVVRAGTPIHIRANRVIVAGGAYASPPILLRSGIGPEADLTRLGIPVVANLRGVGANLLDHPCVQLDFAGSDAFHAMVAGDGWTADEQTVGRARSSRCDRGPYDIHVFMVAGANTGHPGLPPISLYGGAMRARSQGRVTLRDTDPMSTPIIDHRYLSDPDGHDLQVLREAHDLLEQMVSGPALASALGRRVTDDTVDIASAVVNYCHPAGTCKMGVEANPDAVVNSNGQVHGVDGLYVADASVMPTITRGNINLPTATIAANIAARLLRLKPTDLAADGTSTAMR